MRELSADDLLDLTPQETEADKRAKMTPDEKIIEAMRKALDRINDDGTYKPWSSLGVKDERRRDRRQRIDDAGRRDSY